MKKIKKKEKTEVSFSEESVLGPDPLMTNPVVRDTNFKDVIVDYVGNKINPKNDEVTVEMIIEVMAEEFPDLAFCLAKENWILGYKQAVDDLTPEEEAKDDRR